jgi:hypothetical protein
MTPRKVTVAADRRPVLAEALCGTSAVQGVLEFLLAVL